MMVIDMKGYNPTKFSSKVTIAFLKGINYRKDVLIYDISKHEAINRLKNVNFKTFIIECKLRKKYIIWHKMYGKSLRNKNQKELTMRK